MMRVLRRLAFLIRRQDDVADELEFHRQMKVEELRAKGVAEAEIAHATRRSMGNDLLARDRARDVWVPASLRDIGQDVKCGVRMLVKDRRFTVAAVLALGLGIGLNSSVFAFINIAMFKELPFPAPERLVSVNLRDSRGIGSVAPPDFLDWQADATAFEGLAAWAGTTLNLSDDALAAERLRGAFLTVNSGGLLRVAPMIGRDFAAADAQPGAPGVLLIGYETWQGRYGGAPVVGRAVRINGQPSTIIGVMPPRFAFPALAQAWVPLGLEQMAKAPRDRRSLGVFGRLKDGLSIEQARAEMMTVAARVADRHPDSHRQLALSVTALREGTVNQAPPGAYATLLGAAVFVLLVACANVASLLVARAVHRSREMAVRASLGAPRWRLVRQLLIECTGIALLAGIIGYWLSILGGREIARAFGVYEAGAPGGMVLPYWVDLSTDAYALMFVGTVCLLTTLGIGLIPAWYLSGRDVNIALKDGGRSGGSTRGARVTTSALIVAQLAITLVLLSGAGVMMRSFATLYFTDLLADTTGVMTMRIVLPVEKYPTAEDQQRFFNALDERLAAAPQFASAALVSEVPFVPIGFALSGLSIDGEDATSGELPQAYSVTVGPRIFDTLGLAVTQGRALSAHDGLPGQEGVVVNARFASRFFPGEDALGRRIRFTTQAGRSGPWLTVVGVAPTLPSFLRKDETEPAAYVPLAVDVRQPRSMAMLVRAMDPRGIEQAVTSARAQVSALDPHLPVFAVQSLSEAASMGRNSARMFGSWFGTIAGIALMLAAVGLYALTAHSVAQRTHEVGVRMALGARAGQVLSLFLRRVMVQLALGLVLGIAGAVTTGRLLSAFLAGTSNGRDPLTIAAVSALLTVVALAAAAAPARKATRISPVNALRAD
ncbi:MAG TPA: ABC transporter permease [Vicinamibacterales bacterium]|nr:ABC transporter permease [Vicinamibacterales bacterium]